MKSAFEVQIVHYNGNLVRGWGWVTREKKLKIFLILTDFYKIICYQENLVRKYESVSGRYTVRTVCIMVFPWRVCRTVKAAAISWHSRNSDDLKDRPVKARSGADLSDGLGPCSADEHLVVNYERDHRTTLVFLLHPGFPSWTWHIYNYVYLANADTHILGFFVCLLLYSLNGEIIWKFFAAIRFITL